MLRRIFCLLVISWSLAACGREQATPTPIPASVVRPVQPTPAYANSSTFRLTTITPTATVVLAAPMMNTKPVADQLLADQMTSTVNTAALLSAQTSTALGVVTVGAALLESPAGQVLAQLPSGTVLTLTGQTADGRYLAAYTNDGETGWISRAQLTLFGAADLVVVMKARGPGVAATLVAEAMRPVQVLDDLLTATPAATPSP